MATANIDTLKGKWENIEFPVTLKLISSPNKILLDKTNWNTEFNKAEWKETPTVQLETAEPDKSYTLLAVDPDVPLHFAGEAILHWLVININGSDLAEGDLTKAKTVCEYRGPGPLIFTGLHRYIFLIYEEDEVNQSISGNIGRLKFKLEEWLRKRYNTENIPKPVSGIMFQSKF